MLNVTFLWMLNKDLLNLMFCCIFTTLLSLWFLAFSLQIPSKFSERPGAHLLGDYQIALRYVYRHKYYEVFFFKEISNSQNEGRGIVQNGAYVIQLNLLWIWIGSLIIIKMLQNCPDGAMLEKHLPKSIRIFIISKQDYYNKQY